MSVIPITVFFSLLLAGSFVVLFAREQRRRKFASAERDSLLPLADETPRLAGVPRSSDHPPAHDEAHDHEHIHDDHHRAKGRCGCHDGARPPCTGCRRRINSALLSSSTPRC